MPPAFFFAGCSVGPELDKDILYVTVNVNAMGTENLDLSEPAASVTQLLLNVLTAG